MGKLVDENVTILHPNIESIQMAVDYIKECYPFRPDEKNEALRKFQVDDRRSLIEVIFYEIDTLIQAGELEGGIAYNYSLDRILEDDYE